MSCAPRLISLSSSGKRYDSVSRESSVHSMISISWLLMKSINPIGAPLVVAVAGCWLLFATSRQRPATSLPRGLELLIELTDETVGGLGCRAGDFRVEVGGRLRGDHFFLRFVLALE